MAMFTLPSLPDLHAQTVWIITSVLINTKKPIAWKKLHISLFQAVHQDRISDTVNTVAERTYLIYWVSKEEVANRQIVLCKPWWTALAIMIGFETSAILFL